MDNKIFRQKNIDKISSPEKMDDYIRVTTPGMWIMLSALIILLVGALVWGIFGSVTVHHEDGTEELVAPITFIIN